MGDDYLFLCKENYFSNITPSGKAHLLDNRYKQLIEIGKKIIEERGLESFSGFFQEYQFRINLWTAHIIIENASPNEKLKADCLEIIQRYSSSSLNKTLAAEEENWLFEFNKTGK